MRWWFLISLCSLLLLLCDSIDFNRTFKLKRQKKKSAKNNKNGSSIIRKGFKKFMNISQVPTLPPIPTLKPKKVIVNRDNEEYDPCKVVDLCSNGGKCKTKSNEYFCECESDYYGKTCQFFADPRHCTNHTCQNGGTCYSVNKPMIVQNLQFLNVSHTNILKELTVEIQYQCWCKFGFYGTFCEFTEEMQHCIEESCSGHGIVKLGTKNFKCECHCEENYSGEKCETISPCRNLECTNNGKCVISPETGEAKCECPKSNEIYLIEAQIKGEFCEIIHIDDSKITPEKCLPCTGDFQKWIQCIEKHDHITTFNEQRLGLGFLWNFDAESFKNLNGTDCFHEGKCNVVLDKFPHDFYYPKLRNQLFLVPKCDCKESYQGDFCEHIHNTTDGACDPKDGIKDTSKCNPCEEAKDSFKCLNGGTCLFNEIDGLHCYCHYGFKGTVCEIKNPCEEDPKPCEDNNSICVEIPDGTNSPRRACICGFNQDVKSSKCITPDHEICKTAAGDPTCKNKGHCYPCALDENEKISLCTEDETKRGFRCICPPGFLPPFCDHEVTACSYHKCQNGAKCIPKNGTLADYDCECKHDYNGTFCEKSPGICKADGFLVCAHGSCVENSKSERGFDCNCNEGFYGDNCHLEEEFDFFNEIDKHYYWTYPLVLTLILIPFTLIILWLKQRHQLAMAAAEKADLEASKTKAESAILINAENVEITPESIPANAVTNVDPLPMVVVQSKESTDEKKNKIPTAAAPQQLQQSVESGKVNNNNNGISEETQKKAKFAEIQPKIVAAATTLNGNKTPEKVKKNRKLRKK